MESMERKETLKKLLEGDEIYRAYADSARELEAEYDRIAASLPSGQEKVLTGYRQCRELMALRMLELMSEELCFPE